MNSDKITVTHVARAAYRQKILISAVAIVLFSTMLILITVFATNKLSEQRGIFEVMTANRGDGEISLSNTADFAEPTVSLKGAPIGKLDNISELRHIPKDIEDTDGPHNGENYYAHTFYLRNVGDITIDVEEKVSIISTYKGAENAMRFKVYRNGVPTTYAAPTDEGIAEYGTVAFLDRDTVYLNRISALAPGETVKYTVVVWVEGDDPDCTNDIMGGFARFGMGFTVINGSDKQSE